MTNRIDDIFNESHSYRRYLPHIQPINAYYSITCRLYKSLPRIVIENLKIERENFIERLHQIDDPNERNRLTYSFDRSFYRKYDDVLDSVMTGPVWLKDIRIAQIVRDAIHYRDKVIYDLIAYTIMANHIHVVFWLGKNHLVSDKEKGYESKKSKYIVTDVMESFKKFTALRTNTILKRSGRFWARESYDHVLRNQIELKRAVRYVLNNPVKAGLVDNPTDWKWSYCAEEFRL
jgi:putative transposase